MTIKEQISENKRLYELWKGDDEVIRFRPPAGAAGSMQNTQGTDDLLEEPYFSGDGNKD
eukprot:CAMPEP_0170497972 /NCGR_PEP_ID=MMETSP0208-20121228/26381_1 /TAXON_ID=197538 /ORGANISM="Strombidium inclinatum, Strain S3" /LENGTH=58 /DNA_ID=CAMNT_0010774973 /DNA_START=581 /DNA_END=760 /DNA_ORIENTATION=-